MAREVPDEMERSDYRREKGVESTIAIVIGSWSWFPEQPRNCA